MTDDVHTCYLCGGPVTDDAPWWCLGSDLSSEFPNIEIPETVYACETCTRPSAFPRIFSEMARRNREADGEPRCIYCGDHKGDWGFRRKDDVGLINVPVVTGDLDPADPDTFLVHTFQAHWGCVTRAGLDALTAKDAEMREAAAAG